MDGPTLLSRALIHSSLTAAASKAIEEALRSAGLSSGRVSAVFATGIGGGEVPGVVEQIPMIACDAKGARYLLGPVYTVVDIGAESSRAMRCDQSGNVVEFALNDKCASGTGVFLDAMAKALRVPVEEMGKLSLSSTKEIDITSTCVVFAESEVVTQIHRRTPREDILNGIHKSVAIRISSMVKRVGLDGSLAAVGGVANNAGVIKWLNNLTGARVLVPEHPEFAGAMGAVLIANEVGATR